MHRGLPRVPKRRWLSPPTPFHRASGVLALGTKTKAGTILILKFIDLKIHYSCAGWKHFFKTSWRPSFELLLPLSPKGPGEVWEDPASQIAFPSSWPRDRNLSGDSIPRRHLSISHGLFRRVQKNMTIIASNRTSFTVCSLCVTEDRTTLRVDIRLAQSHILIRGVLIRWS